MWTKYGIFNQPQKIKPMYFFNGEIVKTSTSIDEIGQKLKEIECLKGE